MLKNFSTIFVNCRTLQRGKNVDFEIKMYPIYSVKHCKNVSRYIRDKRLRKMNVTLFLPTILETFSLSFENFRRGTNQKSAKTIDFPKLTEIIFLKFMVSKEALLFEKRFSKLLKH